MCIFINTRLQKLLKWHGIACQFGATPKIGCHVAVFVIKAFLHEHREKKLDAHVVFFDLVKACDHIQNDVIKETLKVFGVPRDVSAWIMKLCSKCSVVLKVGMKNKLLSCGCGAKQGCSLAPTRFIMVIQLAAQDLDS